MSIGAVQRQSIISFIWQIALTFIGFLSTIYFARTIGASVLGQYYLFLAYFSIVGMVTDSGFAGAAIKRISEGEEQNEYFSAFVMLRSLFVTVVVIVLVAFRSYFVDIKDSDTLIWLLLALIVSIVYGAISGGLQGCGKVGIQATGNFINNISRIFVQVFSIYLGFEFAGLAAGFIVGMVVGSLVQLRFFDLHLVRFRWEHIKSLSSFSLWVFLISSGVVVFSTSDTVMIGYYLNNGDVGVYRIVLQLTSMAGFTTVALRSTLWPRVSKWGKIGKTNLIEESLTRAVTYSLILAIPMFAGGLLLGDKILYHFYGEDFVRGYMTMIILFLVQIVNIFYYLFTTYMTALDYLKELFKIIVIAVTANILLNAALIPLVGIVGAAIATLVTMGLNTLLTLYVLSKILTIRLEMKSLQCILKASAMMSFFIGCYRLLVPLSSVYLTLVPVVLGAGLYMFLVLRYDQTIHDELKKIIFQRAGDT